MSDEFDGIDLDKERERRAAEREGKRKPFPIRMGGETVATLPVEFPLDVIEPLRAIDQDLALLLRSAMGMAGGEDPMAATRLVIDLLASNPRLPTMFVDTIAECGTRLLGEDGMAALIAYRPTREDVAALLGAVSRFYGLSLGEASASSPSPETGGETSSATSSGTTESTPEASGRSRPKKAS
jgi:hypothetical protein